MRTKTIIAGGVVLVVAAAVGAFVLTRGGDELYSLRPSGAGCLRTVAVSSDGTLLAAAGESGKVFVWDVGSRQLRHTLPGHAKTARCLAFIPHTHTLATGGDDKRVKLWDADAGTEVASFDDAGRVECLAVSPDGKTLAAGGVDKLIHIWSLPDRKYFRGIKGHPKHVHAVAFSPDGKTLAAGGAEATIRLWDWKTGNQTGGLPAPGAHTNSITYLPDGKTLAAVGPTLRWWDLGTRKERPAPDGPSGLGMGVAVSPDSTRLATTHEDGFVRIWDSETGALLKTLRGHEEQVLACTFAPDGKTLLTAGVDGTVKAWAAR